MPALMHEDFGPRSASVEARPVPKSLPPLVSADADDLSDTWTLSSGPMFIPNPPRLWMQLKIVDWIFVTIMIHSARGRPAAPLEDVLLTEGAKAEGERDVVTFDEAVNAILEVCRRRYGRSKAPTFGTNLCFRARYVLSQDDSATNGNTTSSNTDGSFIYEVVEESDPDLLAALSDLPTTLGSSLSANPHIKTVPTTSLTTLVSTSLFLLPNTRLVAYKERKYVAKGPIYASRASADFLDIRNLLALPPSGHPNILPAPDTLVTLGPTDGRICGWLTKLYPRGNADVYSRKLRAEGLLTEGILAKWFTELVGAVRWLSEQGTWHGDLKPDNALVGDRGELVLIDFTRLFATFVTASPEVRRHCAEHAGREAFPACQTGQSALEIVACTEELIQEKTSGTVTVTAAHEEPLGDDHERRLDSWCSLTNPLIGDCGTTTGVPSSWPLETVVRSEVYSLGRTMYLLGEGVDMAELYKAHGWMNYEHVFRSEFGPQSPTPQPLQEVISRCVREDPIERVRLDELARVLDGLRGDVPELD